MNTILTKIQAHMCKYIQDHYKIYMERQRTENSQNDPERKNKAGRLTPPNPKIHPTATAVRPVHCW